MKYKITRSSDWFGENKPCKKRKSIERYTDMEIPQCFVKDVLDAKCIYENCDRTTLEKECTRMFAYIKVTEAYIEELESKLINML